MSAFDEVRERNEGQDLAGATPLDALLLTIGYTFPKGTLDRLITQHPANGQDAIRLIYLAKDGRWSEMVFSFTRAMQSNLRPTLFSEIILWLDVALERENS